MTTEAPQTETATVGEMAARIAVLDARKTAAQQALNDLGEERRDLEARLLETMETEGLGSVKTRKQIAPSELEDMISGVALALLASASVHGVGATSERVVAALEDVRQEARRLFPSDVPPMTVYLRRELWLAAPLGKEAVLVSETYNSQSASAWMRELPRDADDLPVFPADAGDGLGASEKYSIRTRKGS